MIPFEEVTGGLQFPEGPIACADGSVILVEIKRGTLTRVQPDGRQEIVAETGGGPNGAAIGPDGACYVCNNGGFVWHEVGGLLIPGDQPPDYSGGRIERVDLATGEVRVLYTGCDGHPLRGPNDIVFDSQGGFWFTDLGKARERERDRTGIFYALPDGSAIREMAFPVDGGPNGIGLSPEEDRVYVAETFTGRVTYWELDGPGSIVPNPLAPHGGHLLAGLPDGQMLDSLAVDGEGNVCVATLVNGGITVFSPRGEHRHLATDDMMTTNICFGGPDLRTAWITLSSSGRLVKTTWETKGLPLAYGT
ncbi:MAG: gluconolaconase [Deltaproteobacteria bacterium]|nr:gluconolaconase [Deltaproteobacteria bacterium]